MCVQLLVFICIPLTVGHRNLDIKESEELH